MPVNADARILLPGKWYIQKSLFEWIESPDWWRNLGLIVEDELDGCLRKHTVWMGFLNIKFLPEESFITRKSKTNTNTFVIIHTLYIIILGTGQG